MSWEQSDSRKVYNHNSQLAINIDRVKVPLTNTRILMH